MKYSISSINQAFYVPELNASIELRNSIFREVKIADRIRTRRKGEKNGRWALSVFSGSQDGSPRETCTYLSI